MQLHFIQSAERLRQKGSPPHTSDRSVHVLEGRIRRVGIGNSVVDVSCECSEGIASPQCMGILFGKESDDVDIQDSKIRKSRCPVFDKR